MGSFLLRLKNWWQAADRTQKLITVFGGGSIVALLIGTFIFASRPKMSLVFANLAPADAGSVTMAIEDLGIAANMDANGNVEVPSDKIALVRAKLAMAGKLPAAGNHADAALTNMPFIGDPKVQAERLKVILEGDLAQSIEIFDGVVSANVQISPAIDSPFESEKKPAVANVTVSEKPGATISQEEAKAMANLVASSVPGLDTKKVTIFTRTGRALWDGQDMDGANAQTANKLDMEKSEARKRRDELQGTLNRMLGPGNAIAMIQVTIDADASEKTIDSVEPGKPIENQKITEDLTQGSAGAPSPPPTGKDGNDASASTITGGGSSNTKYTVVQSHPIYSSKDTHEHRTHVPGDLKSMSISVLVNQTDKIKVDPKNPDDPIVKLANSYIPAHDPTAAANFPAASVVAYPFDTKQADDANKAADSAAGSGKMQQMLSILPIAALLVVAFFVIRALGKVAGRPTGPMLAYAGGPALQMSPGGQVMQSLQAPAKALDGANKFVLPEIIKQKALEAGISEEQLQAAIEEAGEAGISLDDIPSIKSKVNVPLEQIKKMAHDRPETVSMLIKSWLIEEGIRR